MKNNSNSSKFTQKTKIEKVEEMAKSHEIILKEPMLWAVKTSTGTYCIVFCNERVYEKTFTTVKAAKEFVKKPENLLKFAHIMAAVFMKKMTEYETLNKKENGND